MTMFISGCMSSLSAKLQLELLHVSILSKVDLVANKMDIEDYLDPEPHILLSELNERMAPQFQKLNRLIQLLDEYSMVSFIPLDLGGNSIWYVLAQIDHCIQYGEDADVKAKDFEQRWINKLADNAFIFFNCVTKIREQFLREKSSYFLYTCGIQVSSNFFLFLEWDLLPLLVSDRVKWRVFSCSF